MKSHQSPRIQSRLSKKFSAEHSCVSRNWMRNQNLVMVRGAAEPWGTSSCHSLSGHCWFSQLQVIQMILAKLVVMTRWTAEANLSQKKQAADYKCPWEATKLLQTRYKLALFRPWRLLRSLSDDWCMLQEESVLSRSSPALWCTHVFLLDVHKNAFTCIHFCAHTKMQFYWQLHLQMRVVSFKANLVSSCQLITQLSYKCGPFYCFIRICIYVNMPSSRTVSITLK